MVGSNMSSNAVVLGHGVRFKNIQHHNQGIKYGQKKLTDIQINAGDIICSVIHF
jgi:hypothetical protein